MLKIVPLFFLACAAACRDLILHGNATLGYYYVNVQIGTPPQTKSLILDTGSHQTILPCEGCTNCRDHLNSIFQTSQSSTFSFVDPAKTYLGWKCENGRVAGKCPFQQGYTEGSSYSGYFGTDVFKFESERESDSVRNYNHVFGCAMKETGEFYTQEVDGIIGIGVLNPLEYSLPPTIIDTEILEGRIPRSHFAICVAHNGGRMRFGKTNDHLHLPRVLPLTLDSSRMNWGSQYNVELQGISVG
jgi:hypothetical protein